MIHISSIVAIGATAEPALQDENAVWRLGSLRVPYVTTKREAERLAQSATDEKLQVVVVNPGCVIGPDDVSGSEFGTLCTRFWRGRVPIHFSGGNNFVDVRDVAEGILAAVDRGRAGQRYLLTGENLTWTQFFRALARQSHRTHPRVTLPWWLAPSVARVVSRVRLKLGRRPALTPEEARLVGWYFFFSCEKAKRELGFAPRPLQVTLADTHAFWQSNRRAA